MPEFVLFDNDSNIFVDCYSSLDEAKEGYNNLVLKYKKNSRCEIIEFKGRAPDDFSLGLSRPDGQSTATEDG